MEAVGLNRLWEAMTSKERAREFLRLVKIEYDEMKSRNLVPKKMSKELQAAIIDRAKSRVRRDSVRD